MPRVKNFSSKNQPGLRGISALVLIAVFIAALTWQQKQSQEGSDLNQPISTSTIQSIDGGSSSQAQPHENSIEDQGSIDVWFSQPLDSRAPGPEKELIAAINQAQKSIDIAMYNLTMTSAGDALLAAHKRGVEVRLVIESDAMDKALPQKLIKAGIPVQGDAQEGLMHHKFVVIDGQEVWTGSMNLAQAAAYNDYNNLVRIRSMRIAQDYQVAFNEMFVDKLFGPSKKANTPYPAVNLSKSLVEVYFSPDDGAAQYVIKAIRQAKTSIDFMVYSFTSDEIAQAMIERASNGVRVRGVFDENQRNSNRGTEYDNLKKLGYDVKVDGIPGLLHHKVIIIDNQVVITGSYNFGFNAETINDENLLIIHDPIVGSRFKAEFETIFNNGK